MIVEVIKPGLLVRNKLGMILQASSTVTMVSSKEHNIIVDTGVPGDGKVIFSGLKESGFSPEDIDLVINTHLHGDHMSNNALFIRARFLIHAKEFPSKLKNRLKGLIVIKSDFKLSESVDIIETPGHTLGSISVVVKDADNNKIYVIAGDALPTKENYLKWVPPGINFNPKIALNSMRRIVKIADFVIPGHDDMFSIRKV